MTLSKRDKSYMIWQKVFADDPLFTKFYFNNIYSDDWTYLIEDKNNVIAHVQTLPYKLLFNRETISIHYISGAATHEKYRRKGFMESLLNNALEDRKRKGDILSILIPANKDLYNYYQKHFGYKTLFFSNSTENIDDIINFLPQKVDESSLLNLIQSVEYSRSFPCIIHSEKQISNIISEYNIFGHTDIITIPNKIIDLNRSYSAVGFIEIGSNTIIVKDIFANKDSAKKIHIAIKELYPKHKIIYKSPCNIINTKSNPVGMGKVLSDNLDQSFLDSITPSFISLMHE